LNSRSNAVGSGWPLELLGVEQGGLVGRLDQRDEGRLGAVQRRQRTGRGEVHVAELAGYHVAGRIIGLRQVQPGDVVDHLAAAAGRGTPLHPLGDGDVADELLRLQLDAERGQQGRQRAFEIAAHRRLAGARVGQGRGDLRIGIEEGHHLAAAHQVLVDRVLRLGLQTLRIGQHDDVDVFRDFGEVAFHHLDVELLAQLGQHRIGLRLAAHRGHHAAGAEFHRQRGQQRDLGLLGRGQREDQLGQVVFEETFTLLVEKADDLAVVDQVGADEAEIEVAARGIQRHGPDAGGGGGILGFRERLGVDQLQAETALRQVDVFLGQVAHAIAVDLELRHLGGKPLGVIEAQLDRVLQGSRMFFVPVDSEYSLFCVRSRRLEVSVASARTLMPTKATAAATRAPAA
jgi:hypothetical protein